MRPVALKPLLLELPPNVLLLEPLRLDPDEPWLEELPGEELLELGSLPLVPDELP